MSFKNQPVMIKSVPEQSSDPSVNDSQMFAKPTTSSYDPTPMGMLQWISIMDSELGIMKTNYFSAKP